MYVLAHERTATGVFLGTGSIMRARVRDISPVLVAFYEGRRREPRTELINHETPYMLAESLQ